MTRLSALSMTFDLRMVMTTASGIRAPNVLEVENWIECDLVF